MEQALSEADTDGDATEAVVAAALCPASFLEQNPTSAQFLLTVRGDYRVLWEGVIDGRKPPVEIDVELGRARRLHLTV